MFQNILYDMKYKEGDTTYLLLFRIYTLCMSQKFKCHNLMFQIGWIKLSDIMYA